MLHWNRRDTSGFLFLQGRLGAGLGLAHEVPVRRRAEEAGVAVFGHQHVNLVLGHVKAGRRQLQHVGFGDVTSFMVDVNLEGKAQRQKHGSYLLHN